MPLPNMRYMDRIGALFVDVGGIHTTIYAYRRAVRMACFQVATQGDAEHMTRLVGMFLRQNKNGLFTKLSECRGLRVLGEFHYPKPMWITVVENRQYYGLIGYRDDNFPVSLYVDEIVPQDSLGIIVLQWGLSRHIGVMDRYMRFDYWRDDAIFWGSRIDL